MLIDFLFTFLLTAAAQPPVFRLHLQADPDSLNPLLSPSSVSSYALNALYAPLMRFQDGVLTPFGARRCEEISSTHYRCQLRKDWRWSDDQPILSSQFVSGFAVLKNEKSPRLDNFLNVKDVRAKDPDQLDFYLHSEDKDFLYRLIDPAFGPWRKDVNLSEGRITSGPYFLYSRTPGRSLYLKPNPLFFTARVPRPDVEFLVVDSDDTALRLYLTKKLNFLRRLTAENIPVYKNSPEFLQRSMHRVDYIGFGPQLADHEDLRERLIYSLNPQYEKFLELFGALGRPGCFGLSKAVMKESICAADQNVKRYTETELAQLPRLELHFAMQGGDDIRRAMEFFQAGWKKNLGLNVELRSVELRVLSADLKRSPPPLFRRGAPLERPTCLAALEIFESGNPENLIRLKDQKYDEIVRQLRRHRGSETALCKKGLHRLLSLHRIIPLGTIHYSMLSDQKFSGILLNELGQIDLSGLSPKEAPPKVR